MTDADESILVIARPPPRSQGLNQDKYIVPGLGDFGDRYFGTDISVTGPDSSANPRGRGGA